MDELEQQMQREAGRQAAETGTELPTDQNSAAAATEEKPAAGVITNDAPSGDNASKNNSPAATTNNDAAQAGTTETFTQMLERLSGGSVKNEDDFKAALEKVGQTDVLSTKVKELEEKAAMSPFADEYEQRRNELKKGGATKDQLVAFEKVNDLGDLKTLDPLETKIMKLVLVDGMGEKVARLKIEREFPLDTTHDEQDLEVLKEELRISAKSDLKALEDYKVEVSTPVNDKPIVNAASKAQLESGLKPVLEDFAVKFNSLATIEVGKEGEQAVTHDVLVNADDKAAMVKSIRDYMIDNNLPLTQENYNEAVQVARQEVLERKLPTIIKDVWNKAETHFKRIYDAKFENTGGKPLGDQKPNAGNAMNAEEKAFKDELLGRKN